MGKTLMYVFAFVQLFFMLAQLAILIDAASRVFASDTASKYMPSWLTKTNKNGRPVNSYILTAGISLLILLLSGTLPSINSIYNWLLNLNGIVSTIQDRPCLRRIHCHSLARRRIQVRLCLH